MPAMKGFHLVPASGGDGEAGHLGAEARPFKELQRLVLNGRTRVLNGTSALAGCAHAEPLG